MSNAEEKIESLDIEFVPDEEGPAAPQSRYEWTGDQAEQLRAFIFETVGNGEVQADVAIRNMELYFQWIQSGRVPSGKRKTKSSEVLSLRPVPKDD